MGRPGRKCCPMTGQSHSPDQNPPSGDAPPPLAGAQPPAVLSRELGGDLPCISCGYNLRGLSIRSMCPECGIRVRATILSVVDPEARELQPIGLPRLIVAGLLAWNAGAAGAALLAWLPHAHDLVVQWVTPVGPRPNTTLGVVIAVALSAIGSLALIHPHARIPGRATVLALLASTLYLPLLALMWVYLSRPESPGGTRFLWQRPPSAAAMDLLAGIYALVALIIFCQRPVARLLVARSLILRSGRVDRQTLYVIGIACGVASLSCLLIRTSASMTPVPSEVLRLAGTAVLALASLLITLGLLGALLDSLRICQAILTPRRTLAHVIESGASTPRSRMGQMLSGTTRPTQPAASALPPHAVPSPPPSSPP